MSLDQLLLERLSANTGNLLDDEELIGERILPRGEPSPGLSPEHDGTKLENPLLSHDVVEGLFVPFAERLVPFCQSGSISHEVERVDGLEASCVKHVVLYGL